VLRVANMPIVRHFKVKKPKATLLNSDEFDKWVENYDLAVFVQISRQESCKYDTVYTSELSRSKRTAEHFKTDKTISTPLLNEVPISACFRTTVKLPLFVWFVLGRTAWICGHHSQKESLRASITRAKDAVDMLSKQEGDTLVISHGLFMVLLKFITHKRSTKC
jgi:broad specificity phosphatase PhoE